MYARSAAAVLWCCYLATATVTLAATPITSVDITPDNEGPIIGQPAIGLDDCPDPCASGRNGGRVNGLAAVPGDASTYFAASETGGLFKSTDGGLSWTHLDGHVPVQTWDVAAAPGGQRVYATSFFEGRLDSMIGLEVSKDGGTTWSEPVVAPPASCKAARADQPSAFGIALRPSTAEVLVGTNCGLARSTDGGDTWERFDPLPGGSANSIWDVVALPNGRTYACGDDGLLMSPDGASSTWQDLGKPSPFPGGFCSLAVSPDQPNVVFVVFASPVLFGDLFLGNNGTFFEGRVDDGAATVTWTEIPYPDMDHKKQRVPFVATNKRTQGFDLWVGDGSLWRVPCTADSTPSCTTDTTLWAGSFTDDHGTIQDAHGDSGTIVFDPTKSVDACPTLYSSDGGVHRNALSASPSCHDPDFRGANVGLHAFLLWGMAGVSRAGTEAEDLYFVTQDNGLYFTGDAGAAAPAWTHGIGADAFDVVADPTRVVATNGALLVGDTGFANMAAVIAKFPATSISQSIVEPEPGHFMLAIKAPFEFPAGTTIPVGVRETYDIGADPVGSPIGSWPAAAGAPCHLQVGQGPAGPRPYALAGAACVLGRPDVAANSLWRYEGGAWQQIPPPAKVAGDPVAPDAGFGLLAVDPVDADRLYVSVVRDGPTRMMRSADGGMHWDYDAELSDLMSGGGMFASLPADPGDGIKPYPQPIMAAFDPADANILVAGGFYSGVFFSSNGGTTWSTLTDPFTPGTSQIPYLPRPLFARFDHDTPGIVRVYLGTGRGVWRIDLAGTDLAITKSSAPDPVVTGENVTYTMAVRNDGPNASGSMVLHDDLPPGTTFQSLAAPSGWSCTTPAVAATGTVACKRSDLPNGAEEALTIAAAVSCELPDCTTITNSAALDPELPDPVAGNNDATAITHVSNPPPAITCPADVVVECTTSGGIDATDPQLAAFFAGVSATDNCPGVAIANDPPSFFALGTTVVMFVATDSGGAASSCTAAVTVDDTTPPEITVGLSPDVLWPPDHKMVDIAATVKVTDACDPHPTFVLTSVTSNEPADGRGDGHTPVDIEGAGLGTADTSFRLRSERSGGSGGRVYTIVYTASDQSGNTAPATAVCTVPHNH